ncbi:hypothetical protein V6N11_039876 [Hibiscus sabdariffa]|uniref:Uncharacterized protein n=1 Tax=Hibiscus sabdariffa TaxID=183260 RepID=A0ABR2RG39_9ROSI
MLLMICHWLVSTTMASMSVAMDVAMSDGSDQNHVVVTMLLASVSTIVAVTSVAPSSYKDTLLALVSANIPVVDDIIDEDVVTLLNDYVTRSNEDDLISIQFFEQVQALTVKNLEMTVVIKLLSRRIGYHTLRNKLYDLWKLSQAFRLMDIENKFFFIMFRTRSDYDKAIYGDTGLSLATISLLSLGR